MKFEEAVNICHVRSSIYRTGNPTRTWTQADSDRCLLAGYTGPEIGSVVPNRFPKNHPVRLSDRVSLVDQMCDDWEEYDPREDDNCSLSSFND